MSDIKYLWKPQKTDPKKLRDLSKSLRVEAVESGSPVVMVKKNNREARS